MSAKELYWVSDKLVDFYEVFLDFIYCILFFTSSLFLFPEAAGLAALSKRDPRWRELFVS